MDPVQPTYRRPWRLFAADSARRLAFAAMALAIALYMAVAERDAARVRDGNTLGLHRRFQEAINAASSVTSGPSAGEAWLVRAYANEALGRIVEASAAFDQAARRDPNNWTIHRDWSLLLSQTGDVGRAGREWSRAVALNPRLTGSGSATG